jgi:GT2 family glycosyltransferase
MKKIAVLMTCYNRADITLECLRRLFVQEIPEGYSFDVWLVDDASPDRTGEKVKAAYPQVNVIQGTGNLFWCKGMRLAWDNAAEAYDYDFYLWLNDDVVLKEKSVSNLLLDYDKVGGVIVGTFTSNCNELDISYGATKQMPNGEIPLKGTCGMNGNLVLIPKDVFIEVGPICGEYYHQYGDYDYGWQLRKKGFEYHSSSKFSGICPQQPERYLQLKGRTLRERIKLLFEPKGCSLHDAYLYKKRNYGFFGAMLSVMHVICKVVFVKG